MTVQYYDANEWFPVFTIGDVTELLPYRPDNPREFTDEEIARIRSAFKEFGDVQRLIMDRFEIRGTWGGQ